MKNNFFLGNYQAAINEGLAIQSSKITKDTDKIERDVYIYRSYIAQGKYQIVLDEIKDSPSLSTPLQAVKLLATYLSKKNSDIVLVTLKEWMSDGVAANNPILQIVGATIYYYEGNYEAAMRCVFQSNTLEGYL